MAQSDNQLIREIVKGNEAAMELLVKRHYTMVHSFVYRMVGEHEIAYDLTQEIFIKMMKNIEKYDNRSGEFPRWILRIASNHCKDYFRSPIYRQRMEHKDINDMEISLGDTVIDMFEKNERRKEIKRAIDNLPELQREAVLLKYYNDLKVKEISDITGDKESTIKSRIFNGIKNLKKIIGGDIGEEKGRNVK